MGPDNESGATVNYPMVSFQGRRLLAVQHYCNLSCLWRFLRSTFLTLSLKINRSYVLFSSCVLFESKSKSESRTVVDFGERKKNFAGL